MNKTNTPIRPLVNYIIVLGYKVVKNLKEIIIIIIKLIFKK